MASKIQEHASPKNRFPPFPEDDFQDHFKEVIDLCMSSDLNTQHAGFHLLAEKSELIPVLPKLISFIREQVKINAVLADLPKLSILIRMIKALLSNKFLELKFEIPNLMAPVMTCLVIKEVCKNPAVENPWVFRQCAAELLGEIVQDYNNEINKLQPRVEKLLIEALQPSKPLTTVYGGLLGLKYTNTNFEEIVRSHVENIKSRIKEHSESNKRKGPQLAAERIRNFLVEEGIEKRKEEEGIEKLKEEKGIEKLKEEGIEKLKEEEKGDFASCCQELEIFHIKEL